MWHCIFDQFWLCFPSLLFSLYSYFFNIIWDLTEYLELHLVIHLRALWLISDFLFEEESFEKSKSFIGTRAFEGNIMSLFNLGLITSPNWFSYSTTSLKLLYQWFGYWAKESREQISHKGLQACSHTNMVSLFLSHMHIPHTLHTHFTSFYPSICVAGSIVH